MIEQQIAQVEAQVPPLRGLQPKREVPNRLIGEAAVREDLARSFDRDNPPAELKAQQHLLERLGFMGPGLDLRALCLDALTSQVLGYYRDEEKDMTIVQRSGGFGPLEQMTVAHEYTHALQDQHFDLKSLGTHEVDQSDRSLARLALVEGDASLLMTQWAQANLTPQELVELVQQSSDPSQQETLDRLPPLLRTQLTFPYQEGLAFALRLYTEGGWDAINAAYRSLPDSTEQILHPEKYALAEGPVPVELPPVAQRLGVGWTQSAIDTAGELAIRVWLEGDRLPATPDSVSAEEAAAGWGGDRVASYDGPRGAWAVVWQTAWDTPADADEFASAAGSLVRHLGAGALVAGRGATDVLILVASDESTLQKVKAAVGISS